MVRPGSSTCSAELLGRVRGGSVGFILKEEGIPVGWSLRKGIPVRLRLGERRRPLPVPRGQVDDHRPAGPDLFAAVVAALDRVVGPAPGGQAVPSSSTYALEGSAANSCKVLQRYGMRGLWTP